MKLYTKNITFYRNNKIVTVYFRQKTLTVLTYTWLSLCDI